MLTSIYIVNCSLVLDISHSWDPSTVRFSVIEKPSMPIYNFQSLWHDQPNNRFFAFGGERSSLDTQTPNLAIWRFDLDGHGSGTWHINSTVSQPPFSTLHGLTRPFGGASTTSEKSAFYLGGYVSSHSSSVTEYLTSFIPTPGMLTYDFGDRVWQNITDTGIVSSSGTFQWGGMEYVPFGPNGLLAIFGGETSSLLVYTPGQNERSMSNITLFDPVTKNWYQQAATGDPMPSERNRFCTIGVRDPRPLTGSNSSGTYEM